MSEYIDIKFDEVSETNNDGNNNGNNVVIPAMPEAAVIIEAANVLNNATNAIKEYNIAKQQEITRRQEIKANMKVAMKQIDAQLQVAFREIDAKKELWMRVIDSSHEKDMLFLEKEINDYSSAIEMHLRLIEKNMEIASESNDYSSCMMWSERLEVMLKLRSQSYLALAERRSHDTQMLLDNSVQKQLPPPK